jgi:hypothetical protein
VVEGVKGESNGEADSTVCSREGGDRRGEQWEKDCLG